ncbi:hypothetical protein OFR22_05470 [Brachyspira hyodysenteriae]|nr:hypothetical protein [Brachyspira hyodysenteriae]MCZ9994822.1 hypothetical protein [Brachyspira hyodysenteriae]
MNTKTKKKLVTEYIDAELCSLTEDFIFTHPFEENETNVYHKKLDLEETEATKRDPKLKIANAEMKYAFMTRTEAFTSWRFSFGKFYGK